MYDNQPSFVSRFSGFFLFLIALAVVGFLVFLTIRSARDNSSDGDLAVTTSEESNTEEARETNPSESENGEESSASDDDGVVAASDDDTGLSTTASNDDANDADDASDTVTAADTDGEVASASTTEEGEELPNTGPAENAFAAIIVAAVIAGIYNYRKTNQVQERISLSRSI